MKLITALALLAAVADQAIMTLAKGHSLKKHAFHLQAIPRPPPVSLAEVLAEEAADETRTGQRRPILGRRADDSPVYGDLATFDQLIDHKNPALGTFKQRYWYNTTYYRGPGSPIILYNAGEGEAATYTKHLTNRKMPGRIAQAVEGAAIVIEHRYWGESSPYSVLTPANLTYLTLDNSIADMVYFANNVQLPFAAKNATDPKAAAWVLVGSSYAGALTSFIERLAPGTFWAYYASSAPVQAMENFWQYWQPAMKGMPRNCSADVSAVIDKVDNILAKGTHQERTALKAKFGFQDVKEDLNFVFALSYGPYYWQATDASTDYGSFYEWCDYVENAHPKAYPNSIAPGPEGVGVDKALEGYARWAKEVMTPSFCGDTPASECYNDYLDPTIDLYTDLAVNNSGNRQWTWFLCNEPFQWWQNGAPAGQPTIVSRLLQNSFQEMQCKYSFPEQKVGSKVFSYGMAKKLDAEAVNKHTLGGWSYNKPTNRLLYVNGEFDGWTGATVSSPFRPGGPKKSTDAEPVLIVPGGGHASDMSTYIGEVNPAVAKVQEQAIQVMVKWIKKHPGKKA